VRGFLLSFANQPLAQRLSRPSLCEAIGLRNQVLQRRLVANLGLQRPVAPRGGLISGFELRGVRSKGRSARARGDNSSCEALAGQDGLGTGKTPHPSGDGWRKRRRRPPSPQGRGLYVRLAALSRKSSHASYSRESGNPPSTPAFAGVTTIFMRMGGPKAPLGMSEVGSECMERAKTACQTSKLQTPRFLPRLRDQGRL
jgi:hypothetical protein